MADQPTTDYCRDRFEYYETCKYCGMTEYCPSFGNRRPALRPKGPPVPLPAPSGLPMVRSSGVDRKRLPWRVRLRILFQGY